MRWRGKRPLDLRCLPLALPTTSLPPRPLPAPPVTPVTTTHVRGAGGSSAPVFFAIASRCHLRCALGRGRGHVSHSRCRRPCWRSRRAQATPVAWPPLLFVVAGASVAACYGLEDLRRGEKERRGEEDGEREERMREERGDFWVLYLERKLLTHINTTPLGGEGTETQAIATSHIADPLEGSE